MNRAAGTARQAWFASTGARATREYAGFHALNNPIVQANAVALIREASLRETMEWLAKVALAYHHHKGRIPATVVGSIAPQARFPLFMVHQIAQRWPGGSRRRTLQRQGPSRRRAASRCGSRAGSSCCRRR